MLYIFDSTEKLIATLPKGSFFEPIHREVLNGENTFTFSFSANEDDAQYIIEGNLVGLRDLDAYWQIFEVKRIVDSHSDGLTRTAYCEHILYELLDDIVTDKRPSADATAALSGMLEGTRWQVGIVDDLGASSTNAYYESALSGVQKVANAWQGELQWRIIVSGNQITARYVDLLAMRGTDTGKQFVYSKDVLSIEREVDSSGVYTAMYGRGKGVETESGEGYGRRLTFADVVAPDKPADQEWIGDSDALAQWGRPGNRHRFGVFVDEEETDPAKLLQKTRDELDRRKTPRATYRLDVVSLEELTGYEHEKVRLGDMVRVIDREFSPELVVSARVIEIERDLLDPANTKVVLGSFAPTIVEANINTAQRVSDLANKPYNTKWLDGVIDVLQNAIENSQAYIWETPQGTLHLNAPTYAEATEAMLLGGGRFAIANQKDGQGGWNWRTFGDGSGFTADLLNAGRVRADLVEIGAETTFAPGYDPSLIEGAASMGVDSDCVGLWHFDGSLNSHKGVAVDSDGSFDTGCFGQALNIASGKHLKVASPGVAGAVTFRAKNLAASANGSVLVDVPDSGNTEGLRVGIANNGNLYIEKVQATDPVDFSKTETTITDFAAGTLTQVWAKDGGLQLDTTTVKTWNDFTGDNWEVLA
jgi:phage minor structural protein